MIFPSFVALLAVLPFALATPVPEPAPASVLNPALSTRSLNRLPVNFKSKALPALPRWLVTKEPSEFKVKQARADVRPRNVAAAAPSSTQQSLARGYIRVEDEAGKKLGFLGSAVNAWGEYAYVCKTRADALIVSVGTTVSGANELKAFNGPLTEVFPWFGAVLGSNTTSADLETGSANYGYLAAVGKDAKTNSFSHVTGTTTVAQAASLWTVDRTTKEISAKWYNVDGTAVYPSLVHVEDEPFFALTGDVEVFSEAYGKKGAVTEVLFTFVSIY